MQRPAWGLCLSKNKEPSIWHFSPCSGLIVSGYSKSQQGEHIEKLKTYLNQVIDPYKKFKKMYIVDNTTEDFRGLRVNRKS